MDGWMGGFWKEVEGKRGAPGGAGEAAVQPAPSPGRFRFVPAAPGAGTRHIHPAFPRLCWGEECGWGMRGRGSAVLRFSVTTRGIPEDLLLFLPSAAPGRTRTPAGAWATHGSPNAPTGAC